MSHDDDKETGTDLVPARTNQLDAAATALVRRLVDVGIDGAGPLSPAQQVADKALRRSGGDVEAAVDAVVRSHARVAAAGGFVTGVAGFTTLLVSVPANLAEFYLAATRAVAAIAHLRGYDLSRESVRTEVLLTLVGADSRSVLNRARLGPGLAADAVLDQLPAPALMLINKAVGMHLIAQIGKRSLSWSGRAVPVLGGGVGAGLDWGLLRKIGRDARTRFPHRPAGEAADTTG